MLNKYNNYFLRLKILHILFEAKVHFLVHLFTYLLILYPTDPPQKMLLLLLIKAICNILLLHDNNL